MRFLGCLTAWAFCVSLAVAQSIELPRSADEPTRFAASELTNYLKSMGIADRRVRFEIGDTVANQRLWRSVSKRPALSDEGFLVDIDKKSRTVHLTGRSPRATLYAVYHFLEMQGCRFFAPGPLGEVIPNRRRLLLPDGQQLHSPAMHTREIGGAAPPGVSVNDAIDWRGKNRLNRAFTLRPGRFSDRRQRRDVADTWGQRGGVREWQWISHNFPFVFPPEQKWFERHPEYFALYQGRRRKPGIDNKPYYGGGNLALTNPDVIRHTAEFAAKWFRSHPAGEVVPVWPNDGPIYWDESPEAMAFGGRNFTLGADGSMTARLVHFANEVAKQVGSEFGDERMILLPAYANYILPLDDPGLEPNVLVQYCYHGDYAHGPDQSDVNAESAEQMRTWAGQARHFGVWEYFLIGDYHQAEPVPVLLPLVYRIRDTVRFLQKIDCRHYFVQSTPAYQNYNSLVYYALARYLWDPDLDADELIADYCRSSFGAEAGEQMTTFYRSMEVACQSSKWTPTSYADVVSPSPLVFSKSLIEQLSELLKQAKASDLTDEQKVRLALVETAFESTIASVHVSPSVDFSADRSSRVMRTRDAYVIDPDGPVVSPQRFEALVQQAIDTGYGGPDLDRIAFRSQRRVESLQRLQSGWLSLAVIPGIGGRAVRLTDRQSGWNYFLEGPISQAVASVGTPYVNYGGYETAVGPQSVASGWERAFTRTSSDATSMRIELEGDGWTLQRTYQVEPAPNAASVVETLTQTDSQTAKRALMLRSQFTLGGKSSDTELYRRDRRGWQQLGTVRKLHNKTHTITGLPTSKDVVHDDVAAWHPETRRGLLIRTQAKSASDIAQLVVSATADETGFRFDRTGKVRRMSQGDTLALSQSWQPFAHPRDIGLKTREQPSKNSASAGSRFGVTGKPAGYVVRQGAGGAAASFDARHRLILTSDELSSHEGTLAAWVQVSSTDGPPQWILSSGDNADAWLAVSVSGGHVSWLSKLGKPPYTGPGEAYTSLAAQVLSDDGTRTPPPSKGAEGTWKHLAISWKRQPDPSIVQLTIRVDGKVVQQRDNLPWPCGFPRAPLVIGGNSASSQTAGPVTIDDLVLLNRAITGNQDADRLMQSPGEVPGVVWYFPFDHSINFESAIGE